MRTHRPPVAALNHATRWAILCLLTIASGLSNGCRKPPARGAAPATVPEEPPPLPRIANVVIHLVDTLRADRLGVYGHPRNTSPRLDALAAESVVFERCNAPAPWTLPSVASLLTSTFPCEHGVVVDGRKVDPELAPLAVRLKRAGYHTATWTANPYSGPLVGLEQGYDYFRFWDMTRGGVVEEWLRTLPAGPFFVFIHNMEPHDPYRLTDQAILPFGTVPRPVRDSIAELVQHYRMLRIADWSAGQPRGTTDNTAAQQETIARLDELRDAYDVLYDAAVRMADDNLGSVLDMLQAQGRWDDTLFIFLSDHGEEFGEHRGWLHGQSAYEELLHVPLLIRFPRGEFGGRRIRATVSLVDVLPTILDYLRRPELMQPARGTSLMPLIRGEASRRSEEIVITGQRIETKKFSRRFKETRGDQNVAIHQGDWKGIYNVEYDTLELYDLSTDPSERHDLSGRQQDRAAALRQYAKQWLATCGTSAREPTAAPPEALDPRTRQQLEALGYLNPQTRPAENEDQDK